MLFKAAQHTGLPVPGSDAAFDAVGTYPDIGLKAEFIEKINCELDG